VQRWFAGAALALQRSNAYLGLQGRVHDRTQTRTEMMNDFHYELNDQLDLIAVERQARALRAQVVADGARALVAWVRARLTRAPQGRTA
jgi:hypothetical protein